MMYMKHKEHAMPTMTIANARAHLGDVVGRVRHAGDRLILTARGKPAVAIVSVADLDALEAAEDAEDIRLANKARADYNSGKDKGVPWETVKAEMATKRKLCLCSEMSG